MKITTTVEAFVAALKCMRSEKKGTLPVLMYVKFSGTTLTATDLVLWTIVPFEGKGKGEVLIPHKQALAVLQGEKGPLEIETIEPKKTKAFLKQPTPPTPPVKIRVSGCEYTFDGMPLGNFPETPKSAESVLEIDGKAFRTMYERVRFTLCNDETRYALRGALLKASADKVVMVGTDGHRLSHVTNPGDYADFQTLIASTALDYLKTHLGESIKIGADNTHQTFRTGNVTLIARKLSGQFPDYEAVMRREDAIKVHVKVDTKISPTILRVAKCSDERSYCIKVHFGEKSTISAESSSRGKATAPLPVVSDGELTIEWNATYILDFLKAIKDEPFTIDLKDNQSAAVFSVENFKHIVMPIRI